MFKDYCIWSRIYAVSKWTKTFHTVRARTDKEAQSKTRRKFSGCGFSYMSLIAVERGVTP